MSPSGKKIVSRKQCWKNLLVSQTNSTHKYSQLGSHITEPISAWKVYFSSWPPGEIYGRNLQWNLVFHIALKAESNFLLLVFFLKLLEQNQVGNKGTTVPLKSKLRRLGGLKKLVKENTAASNESINLLVCSLLYFHLHVFLVHFFRFFKLVHRHFHGLGLFIPKRITPRKMLGGWSTE